MIAGTVGDYLGIKKLWLTIQDDRAGTYWNDSMWQTGPAIIAITIPALTPTTGITEKLGNWQYTKLTKEAMRSGKFTITAYAEDKGGLLSTAQISTEYRKRYDLGKKEFADYSLSLKEVKNIARSKNTDSFITSEVIGLTAEILPLRVAAELNSYVKWNVLGATDVSGKPTPPKDGNKSLLFLTIPPIPAKPDGRSERLGYTVFPRVEYYDTIYYGQGHRSIYQNNLDTLRQEYVDLSAPIQAILDFDQTSTPDYPRLLDFDNGDIDRSHQWWIVKDLLANAIRLKNAYTGNLNVTAGYRCPVGNRAKGGVYNSRHMRGTALDYNQNSDSKENCKVWGAAKDLGVTENLLYDFLNGDKATSNPVCPPTILQDYRHGHVAW